MASEIFIMINNGYVFFLTNSLGEIFENNMKNSPLPATEETIKAIDTVKIEQHGLECSICLEEYEVGEEVKEMKCCHKFHANCVEKWLRVNGSCPVCRFRLPDEKVDKKETKDDESVRNMSEMRIRFVNGEMVIDHGVL